MDNRDIKKMLSIRDDNQKDEIAKYEDFVKTNFLKKKSYFRNYENAHTIYTLYSDLFKLIMSPNKICEKINSENVFEYITRVIQTNCTNVPLVVKSKAGHGKTEFLSVLYQYLLDEYYRGELDQYPLYVSLHYYNKKEYKSSRRMQRQATKLLGSDIEPILTYLDDCKISKILVIIDGPDDSIYAKVNLEHILLQNIRQYTFEDIRIIGLRQYEDPRQANCIVPKDNATTYSPEMEITLGEVPTETQLGTTTVEIFSKLEMLKGCTKNANKLQEYILNVCKKLSIRNIDMFHLYLLTFSFQNRKHFANLRNTGDLYEQYIKHRDLDVNEISMLAYKMYHTLEQVRNSEKNTRIWWKLQKHSSLCAFFAAYYIASKLIENSNDSDDIFNYVYPYTLNSFCKDIINEDNESQENAYITIERLFDKSTITARTHFCYLLGRFENAIIRQKARDLLQKEEVRLYHEQIKPIESTNIHSTPDKQLLLLHRTICISLICLGDNSSSQNYIRKMLNNKAMDDINRGFHLEYYEDIVTPLTTHTELLTHQDNLCNFPKTFHRLYDKLYSSVNEGTTYSLFEVELYTLCSLIQHRLEKGIIFDDLDKVINLIHKIIDVDLHICPLLKEYLVLCVSNFMQREDFRIGMFIREIYSLKDTQRKGWIKRKISNPESIASHIWGTSLLAYFFLPNSMPGYADYDKGVITQMLIIHDIAEAYVGDMTPQEKDERARELERICYNYIALMGTYDSIHSIDIAELFSNFTNSNNINCKIARELDKLDNLMQLYIYKEKYTIEDFDNFRDDLVKDISTNLGKQIMSIITSSFQSKSVGLKSIIDDIKSKIS